MLSLYNTVTRKTLISETMGIEGRKLLTPEDEFEALREFNAGMSERSLLNCNLVRTTKIFKLEKAIR